MRILLNCVSTAAVVLLAGLLILTAVFPNVQVTQRDTGGFVTEITQYQYRTYEKTNTPSGIVHEYSFTIPDDLRHDTALGFYLFHQFAAVYLDDTCIYKLEPSGRLPMIKTPGYNWAVVPIYAEDAGREIRVEIIPVYRGQDDEKTEFLFGASSAIVMKQLKMSWLKLALCEMLIFTGVLLILFSFYYRKTYKAGAEITAFGVLSLIMGIWRYVDSRFFPFMFPDRPIFLFLLSFSCMIMGMIPLITSQRKRIERKIRYGYMIAVAVLGFTAALLQWYGAAELRQFIWFFHLSATFGFVLVCIPVLRSQNKNNQMSRLEKISLAVLFVGALLDGFFFYVHRTEARTVFLLIALLVYIIIAAFSVMTRYKKQMFEMERKSRELEQSRISSMMGQIRSHLIFNILNAISGMCKYDPEKADETIVCFARYLRANIDIIDSDQPIPFSMALGQLEDYIALEQIRYPGRILVEKKIEVSDFLFPPLILQPIVENAVKHGILPKREPGTICLRTWEEGDVIKLSVTDDGVGCRTQHCFAKEGSVGLKNVRLRLQYMMNGTMELESQPGAGTTVTITIQKI